MIQFSKLNREASNLIKKNILIILILIISTVYTYQGAAMSLFFGKKSKVDVVLFSPLEGKLTFRGEPLSNTKIKLHISWKDKEGESFYYSTDTNGFFSIPKIKSEYEESPLAQLVIRQELTVEHDNNFYEVWTMSKMESAEFTELGGKPVGLVCEVTDDLTTVRGIRSLGGVACTWESLTIKKEIGNGSN
jgi:hypothetical protein